MKKVKFFGLAGIILLASGAGFSSCSSDSADPSGGTGVAGQVVKTQFYLNIPYAGNEKGGNARVSTRMSATNTQKNNNFLGLVEMEMFAFEGEPGTTMKSTRTIRIGDNTGTSDYDTKRRLYSDIAIPVGTTNMVLYTRASKKSTTSTGTKYEYEAGSLTNPYNTFTDEAKPTLSELKFNLATIHSANDFYAEGSQILSKLNKLSFFIGEDLFHHEANKMGANSVSYTIYLPRNNYQNLSLANTGSADNVQITGDNTCKTLALQQEQKDTINSHNIGLFSSRFTINENDFEHDLYTTLYMANCAAVVVIDQSKVQPTRLWGFVEGMATQFQVNDSLYTSTRNTLVRANQLNEGMTTYSVPSHDALYTVSFPSTQSEWRYHVITQINGKYTETIFTMNEPLKAGRIKIIKTILKEDGSLSTSSTAVGVSVKLDWKPGGSHDIDI